MRISEFQTEGAFHNPGHEDSPVAQAITRRILMQRTDLLAKYGPEKVGQAVDEVADFIGDVDEIGSSDVSGWVKQVERQLNDYHGVAEGAPIVVMPSHKRLEKKHKPSLSRGMDPAKAQGEQDARDGKPYNNPYPFKKELGAPGNWEHNLYKASYDSVKKGVAEGEEQGLDNKYRRTAKKILKVYETNPKVKAIVDASPEFYRALVYETGVIKNPEHLDGTTHYHKLVDELESIFYYGREEGVAEGSLEEIDRRGFLKGLGAAAVAGAAGGAMATPRLTPEKAYAVGFLSNHSYWLEQEHGKDAWNKFLRLNNNYGLSKNPEIKQYYEAGNRAGKAAYDENNADFDDIQQAYGKGPLGDFNPSRIMKARAIRAKLEKILEKHWQTLSNYNESVQQGVAEGTGNIGARIKSAYQKIYSQGDDAIEFMYYDSPIFAQYWDEYEGDLDSIIAEVDPKELQIILDELESAVEDQGIGEAYTVTRGFDKERYQERPGLEGPFSTRSGKVVYYDPKEGKYYDPDTDFYIGHEDYAKMDEAGFGRASGRASWDSNMPGYQGDYGGAENWGRRHREDDEFHDMDRRNEEIAARGTWYITINGKLLKNKEGQPFTFVGKAAANKAALTMMQKPFNQGKKFMLTTKGE